MRLATLGEPYDIAAGGVGQSVSLITSSPCVRAMPDLPPADKPKTAEMVDAMSGLTFAQRMEWELFCGRTPTNHNQPLNIMPHTPKPDIIEDQTAKAVAPATPCSAFLHLADAHELSALSHSDEGDKDSAKLDMDTAYAIRALVTALTDANDQCRSAMAIAQRSGEATNWPAFAYRMSDSLKRQHAVMYPPNKELSL